MTEQIKIERNYNDGEGNSVTLDELCRREPEWAASRIRFMRKELDAALSLIRSRGIPESRATTLPVAIDVILARLDLQREALGNAGARIAELISERKAERKQIIGKVE